MPERDKAVIHTLRRIIGDQRWRRGECESMPTDDFHALYALIDRHFVEIVDKRIDWNRVFTTAVGRCDAIRNQDDTHATWEPVPGVRDRFDFFCPDCMIECLFSDVTVNIPMRGDKFERAPRELAEYEALEAAGPISALFERLFPIIMRHLKREENR